VVGVWCQLFSVYGLWFSVPSTRTKFFGTQVSGLRFRGTGVSIRGTLQVRGVQGSWMGLTIPGTPPCPTPPLASRILRPGSCCMCTASPGHRSTPTRVTAGQLAEAAIWCTSRTPPTGPSSTQVSPSAFASSFLGRPFKPSGCNPGSPPRGLRAPSSSAPRTSPQSAAGLQAPPPAASWPSQVPSPAACSRLASSSSAA